MYCKFQIKEVDEIIIHEKFYMHSFVNNIALIFLIDGVPITNHISTVCLPFCPLQDQALSSNHIYITAGWGGLMIDNPKIL